MPDHHAVQIWNQRAKGRHFLGLKLGFGPVNHRQQLVRVNIRTAIRRKMLATAQNPLFTHRLVEDARKINDLPGRRPITPPLQ